MNTKINLGSAHFVQTILIVFMVCVTVIVSTNSYAIAQVSGDADTPVDEVTEEGNINVVPVVGGGPGFIMVSPYNFKSLSSGYPTDYDGTTLINPSTDHSIYAVTGITLPHGATITKLTLFYYDDSSLNVALYFYKVDTAGESTLMKGISTVGEQALWRSVSNTAPITDPIVDNQNYSYFLQLYLPSNASTNLKISNVRIDYAYTSSLPTVMK